MKKRCLCTILCFALALVLSAASASESEAGTLVELWLKHDDSYDAELIRNGDACVTDESVSVGGSIDGFDIADFTWERLTGGDGEDYPHTAEGLLLCFRPYSGDASFYGFDSGFLQNVNYRFGESKVSLIDNELFCTNYALGDSVYITQYAIYCFSIKSGSYAGDLLVVDIDPLNDGSPDCLSVMISENDTAYHDERAYHPDRIYQGQLEVIGIIGARDGAGAQADLAFVRRLPHRFKGQILRKAVHRHGIALAFEFSLVACGCAHEWKQHRNAACQRVGKPQHALVHAQHVRAVNPQMRDRTAEIRQNLRLNMAV